MGRKINEYNILTVNIQIILTISVLVLFIMFLFNREFLWLLEIVSGCCLLIMGYNNNIIFRRENFTRIYIIVGIIIIIIGIFTLLGVI